MKRIALLLLALMLCACPMALAEDADAALDKAFEAGHVRFEPVEPPLPDFDSCELVVPEGFWEFAEMEPLDEAQLCSALKAGELRVASVSPDGSAVAAQLAVGEAVVPIVCSPDRVAVIFPSAGRGVEDVYGNMEKTYGLFYITPEPRSPMNTGDEGVIWSPDGRYFCALNVNRALLKAQYDLSNPILVDTQTGEMFLVDTYSGKFMAEDMGAALTGCFSEDGQSFYVLYYGHGYAHKCVLLRYDVQTCEKEVVYDGLAYNGYPALARLRDGSFLTISDTPRATESQLLARFRSNAAFTQAVGAQMPVPSGLWYANRLYYSPASGWALVRGTVRLTNFDTSGGIQMNQWAGLMRLRPDEEDAVPDEIWLARADADSLEPVSLSAIEALARQRDVQGLAKLLLPYTMLLEAKLSPGGRYAALLVGNAERARLLIVRLEDMAALPLEGAEEYLVEGIALLANKKNLMEWSGAGLLIYDSAALGKVE